MIYICLDKNIAFQCGIHRLHAKLLSFNIRRIRNICQIVGKVCTRGRRGKRRFSRSTPCGLKVTAKMLG